MELPLKIHQSPEKMCQAFLVFIKGVENHSPDLGRRYSIFSEGLILSNEYDADIVLQQHQAPCQLQIVLQGSNWYIDDLRPPSNASLNGIPFQIGYLKDGDIIQIGKYAFEFCLAKGIKARFYAEIYQSLNEDLVTHVFNRKYLQHIIKWEINRHRKSHEERRVNDGKPLPSMSLLMFDIDHFGKFNKKHGHLIGDEVLLRVVDRAIKHLRITDILARWGGEEFLVYLPDTTHQKATEIAEELRKAVADEPFVINSRKNPGTKEYLTVTISLGVSIYQKDFKELDDFVSDVNKKMLHAKVAGRNRVISDQKM